MNIESRIQIFRYLQSSKNFCVNIFLLLIISVFYLSASAFAKNLWSTHRKKFKHITVDQGLSQNTPMAIIQDRKGFIWIGTQEGLNRYDGYGFKVYEHDPDDDSSLSENSIFSLYECSEGDIWIGTNGGGLNRFDRVTEKFTQYNYNPQDSTSLSNNFVHVIYEDKAGLLWIGTNYGLNKFDRKSERFTQFYIDQNNTLENQIRAIFEDKNGNFWIGTYGGGLNKFDRNSLKWTQFFNIPNNQNSLSNDHVTAIYEDSFGEFWVGTLFGLNLFDKEKKDFIRFRNIPGDPTSLSHNVVWKIYEDRSGTLWVGTQGGGLCEFDRRTRLFKRHVNESSNPNSLNNNFILSILEDESAALWVGTGGGGINKYDRQNTRFFHYKNAPSNLAGSDANFTWTIEEDHTGALWIGSQGSGLYFLDRKTEKVKCYLNDHFNPNSLSYNSIFSILEDRSGTLWVGTDGGGLNKLIRQKNESGNIVKFIHYFSDPSDSTSLGSNRVRKVFEDRDGTIWLATYGGGLNSFDRETEKFTRYMNDPHDPNSLSSDYVYNIYEDRAGVLWIGTWGGGMLKFDKDTKRFTRFLHNPDNSTSLNHNRVGSFLEDDAGIIWCGTGYGLAKFDKKTNKFKRYTKKNGLPDNVVYGVLPDSNGNLWISTNHGLSRFNPESEKFKNYDVHDGLQSNEFNAGAYLKTRNGELIFGGINGINIFYPEDIIDNFHVPPVVLTAFKSLSKNIRLKKAISEIEQLKLSYTQNSFSFEFAALDYVNPAKNQYAYKLEGYDSDWIYSCNNHIATYTHVPPGNYVLKVKGSNNDGVWNEQGASIKIIITPPFWKTVWFKSLLVLIIITTACSLYKKRIRKIETKKQELQERVTEKTRAANALQKALDEVEKLKNRLQAENVYLQDEIRTDHNFKNIITQNENFKKVLRSVEQVASTDATVLIMGESGTGKELLARAVHSISQRKERPLVKVNCSALPVNLIESELFGHEKGAFTGAIYRKIGRFELADKGTIFLDEIGDLPLELQTKLLRVLQEGEFERLGNSRTIAVDVRVIAATNRNLEKEIDQGAFREDLYYRLNVFPIKLPPLHQRKDDIPLLVHHFIKKYSKKIGKNIDVVPQNVIHTLTKYHWPGNVRELENIIERAVIISPTPKLLLGDWFTSSNGNSQVVTLEENEKQHIIRALKMTGWRISGEKGVARILGINPKTLDSRMRKLGIRRDR